MQPYLFPYIGYFQLLHAVDEFVIYDDVNYIPRGWINRNRLLINGQPHRFTIPVKHASQNKLICDICMAIDDKWEKKFLRMLQLAYKKAPHFDPVYSLVADVIRQPSSRLIDWFVSSIESIFSYLDLEPKIRFASEIPSGTQLKGQDRILAICQYLEAEEYVNPENGKQLYDYSKFLEKNIQLMFLHSNDPPYSQFQEDFLPRLSIIDVLMFNDQQTMQRMLTEYSLYTPRRKKVA